MPEILQFIVAVRRRLGEMPEVPGLRDPLAEIVKIVQSKRHSPEAKTLAAAVVAIWRDSGNLPETAVYSLDQRSCALVVALFDDRVQRRYGEAKWLGALEQMSSE